MGCGLEYWVHPFVVFHFSLSLFFYYCLLPFLSSSEFSYSLLYFLGQRWCLHDDSDGLLWLQLLPSLVVGCFE